MNIVIAFLLLAIGYAQTEGGLGDDLVVDAPVDPPAPPVDPPASVDAPVDPPASGESPKVGEDAKEEVKNKGKKLAEENAAVAKKAEAATESQTAKLATLKEQKEETKKALATIEAQEDTLVDQTNANAAQVVKNAAMNNQRAINSMMKEAGRQADISEAAEKKRQAAEAEMKDAKKKEAEEVAAVKEKTGAEAAAAEKTIADEKKNAATEVENAEKQGMAQCEQEIVKEKERCDKKMLLFEKKFQTGFDTFKASLPKITPASAGTSSGVVTPVSPGTSSGVVTPVSAGTSSDVGFRIPLVYGLVITNVLTGYCAYTYYRQTKQMQHLKLGFLDEF